MLRKIELCFQAKNVQLTIVNRPSASIVFSIGNVISLNNSKRRRKDETVSSNLPRPNCNFEQSNNTICGFC